MTNINQLPRDVLLHIFSYLKSDERFLVVVISKVCRIWKCIVKDSFLWESYNGTLNFQNFVLLCKQGVLSNARYVKFSDHRKLVDSTVLSKIYSGLPRAKRINFSKVKTLKENFFTTLECECPDLCEIVFGDENSSDMKKINYHMFTNFFSLRGHKLTHLDFSHSHIINAQKIFVLIAETCPNLEELLVLSLATASSNLNFPIAKMQLGCPKLKVLRLGFPMRYNMSSMKSYPGFPELEVFTHSSMIGDDFRDQNFLKLLFLSDKLKVLDFRGCDYLTVDAVCSLPASDMQRLYISGSKINVSKGVKDLLMKWRHSLIELDISRNDREDINKMLSGVVAFNGMSQLERLTISSTKLNVCTLRLILQNCTKLNYLQIEGCRRIGRGMMHSYFGQQELENLLTKLMKTEYD